jgi:tRNA threonylcarbamoyladenosine biosynthesis protein TsaB
MPIILAIETSSELASCALLQGNQVLHRASSGVRTHSQSILPMVQQVLQEAGIALSDCAAIAYGCGPGSFTGVRTACGIAQGLAFGASLPVVPVVTLAAMAQACRERTGANDILVVSDARMGEVYWAQYSFDNKNGWRILVAPTLSKPVDVSPLVTSQGTPQGSTAAACGNGFAVYADEFDGRPFASGAQHDIESYAGPHAIAIAQLARIAFVAGAALPAQQAQPLYLRNKIAFTTAERRAIQLAQATSIEPVAP